MVVSAEYHLTGWEIFLFLASWTYLVLAATFILMHVIRTYFREELDER